MASQYRRPLTILIDHNIAGQARLLRDVLVETGWLDLLSLRMLTLAQAGLPVDSSDVVIWRFAQQHRMLILTDNRRMAGNNSLEETIRTENTTTSMPVITVGNRQRLRVRSYREQCASRLVEIILDLDQYLGTGRVYIP